MVTATNAERTLGSTSPLRYLTLRVCGVDGGTASEAATTRRRTTGDDSGRGGRLANSIQPTTSCDHDWFLSYFDSRAFGCLTSKGSGKCLCSRLTFVEDLSLPIAEAAWLSVARI